MAGMTPPQTPKPLTEKEPLTDEEFRNAERDLDRAVNPDDCVVWTAAYGEILIAELKRFRATQAREKILSDALKLEKQKAEFYGHRYYYSGESMPNAQARDLFAAICERTNDALKQADDTPSEEIKDGPSEEDRHRLRIHESMHEKEVTKPHNCEFCWILSELKKAWGIE